MSSPLYRLTRAYAGVQVRRENNRKDYVLDDEAEEPLVLVKPDTLLVQLDEEQVLSPDGESIQPTGRFYATAETINPYHLVLDIMDMDAVSYVGFP